MWRPRICYKAGSGMGGGGGNANPERSRGFAMLQGYVGKARTQDLMNAYNEIGRKALKDRSEAERAAYAAVTDELANRNKIVMDSGTGEFVPNRSGKPIVYMQNQGMDRAYRVNKISKTPDGTYFADADVLVNGRWTSVRGWELQKRIAQEARRKK